MNESIKDRFLKAHALNDDELEKVSGGDDERSADCKGWGICGNPSCSGYNPVPVYFSTLTGKYHCGYCQWANVTGFDF